MRHTSLDIFDRAINSVMEAIGSKTRGTGFCYCKECLDRHPQYRNFVYFVFGLWFLLLFIYFI